MKKIRIGKDIAIKWKITLPEDFNQTLSELNLSVWMKDPKGNKVEVKDFSVINDEYISIGLLGTAFAFLGDYTLSLYKDKGEVGQSVVDVVKAFTLVGSTGEEDGGCNCGCGVLDVSTLDLYSDLSFVINMGEFNPEVVRGPKGDKGDKGDPFTYNDFTPEQLESIKNQIINTLEDRITALEARIEALE